MGTVRQFAIYGLVAMLCINVSANMFNHIGIEPVPLNSFNYTQHEQAFNSTEIVDTWTWGSGNIFYDLINGLNYWFGRAKNLITAFPDTLKAMEVPEFIYKPLYSVWIFLFFTFITLAIIAGRDV